MKDLSGMKFNRLVVVEKTAIRKHGQIVYKCLCDCGNFTNVKSTALRKGFTKSCGCYKKEVDASRGAENGRKRYKDLTNQKFGRLIVVSKTDKRINKKVIWKCLCKCGKEAQVMSSQLLNGKTQSCGCYSLELSTERFRKLGSSLKGDKHYNFNANLTEEERAANESRGNLKGYSTFRKRVLKRDGHTCAACNFKSVKGMRVHHLESWSNYPEGRFDESNGITLCAKCHDIQYPGSFHNIYGNGNNTKIQFKEFLNNFVVEV